MITKFNGTNNRRKVKTSHCRANGYVKWQRLLKSFYVVINDLLRRRWGSGVFLPSHYFLLFERRKTLSNNTEFQWLCRDAYVLCVMRAARPQAAGAGHRTGHCASLASRADGTDIPRGGAKHTITRLLGQSMWTTWWRVVTHDQSLHCEAGSKVPLDVI